MKKWIILLLLLGIFGGGAAWWYEQGHAANPTVFRTTTVERGSLVATIGATGTIEPEEVVDIGAQVAGQIKEFGKDPRDSSKSIDYGTPVDEGTVLARIDDSLYQSQVIQAKANLKRAEAELAQMRSRMNQAENDWKRARELSRSKGVISDLDYDTSQATFETSKSAIAVGEAGVAQAAASLKQSEINLSYTTIKAPVKGIIIDRRVNIGQTVVASLNAPSLFLIAKDLRRLQIWASVNEADIDRIQQGQRVRFTVDGRPNEEFGGEVVQIRLNASMTQNVVTYTVVVATDNSTGKLIPYRTANLQFLIAKRENVIYVPNAALRWRPQPANVVPEARDVFAKMTRRRSSGGAEDKPKTQETKDPHERGIVWTEEDGMVRPVKVRLGLSDGASTEILGDDLPEGTTLVVGEIHKEGEGATTNPFTPQMFGKKQ